MTLPFGRIFSFLMRKTIIAELAVEKIVISTLQ